MLAMLQALVLGFALLTVVYLLVSAYSRSVRREKLENRFDAGDVDGDRDTYISEGMQAYDKGLRKKLIWLVYVIPMAVVAVTIYLVNHA